MTDAEKLKKMHRAASSPAARAKAAATYKRRRAEKMALKEQTVDIGNTFGDESPTQHASMSLDAIPDREPKRKYNKQPKPYKHVQGHFVTDKEWMFLQMAKMMLKGLE